MKAALIMAMKNQTINPAKYLTKNMKMKLTNNAIAAEAIKS